MNLYQVYNGYMGDGPVNVVVIANNEHRARELASANLKESVKDTGKYAHINPRCGIDGVYYKYPEIYWTKLEVVLLHEDTSLEFVSETREG